MKLTDRRPQAFFFGQKQPTSNDEYNTLPPAKPKTDTNANYFQPQIPEIADAQLEIPETSGLLYTPEASSHLDSPEASSQLSTPEVFNQLNTPEDSIQFGTSETSTATPVKTLYEINNQLDQTQTELRALQGSVDKFSQGFDMFKGNLSQLQMAKERSDQIENDLKYLSAGMKSIKALQGYDEKLNSRVKQLENELKTSSNEFISVDKFEAMQMDSSANSAGILARLEKLEAAQKDFPEAQKYCLSETVQLKKRMQKIEETAKKLEAAQKDMAAAQENPLSETVQLKKRMQKIEDQIKQLKEEDVITSTILSNIEYWGKMGFKDEDEMRNFATHVSSLGSRNALIPHIYPSPREPHILGR